MNLINLVISWNPSRQFAISWKTSIRVRVADVPRTLRAAKNPKSLCNHIANQPQTRITMTWIFWEILSAIFAAATAVLAKVGVEGIDSNLATATRTTVVFVFTWAIA